MSVEVQDSSGHPMESSTATNRLSGLEATNPPSESFRLLATYQVIYSIVGLLAGLLCMLLGVGLYVRQITESIGWIAGPSKIWGYLFEATPGIALFVAGLFIICLTRLRWTVKPQQTTNKLDGKNSGNNMP